MSSVWFVVPAHGRLDLTSVCLRQLRRTCDDLAARGVEASAVVIADDANLDTARDLGFGTVTRQNVPLGRKWNDGYELAGRAGVDYVIALGTDDWIDPALVHAQLLADGEVRCSKLSAVVSEDGSQLATLRIGYPGGDGVRVIPTALLASCGYRPAEDDRKRAIDTSVMRILTRRLGRTPEISYVDVHPLQIVDWKSAGEQLNSFEACCKYQDGPLLNPWEALAAHYPTEALDEMRALHTAAVAA